jgi:hypothetical protein
MLLQANPLRELLLDRTRQIPYEVFHNEGLGINKTLFECFWRLLTGTARYGWPPAVVPPVAFRLTLGPLHRVLLAARLAQLSRPQGWPTFTDMSKFAVWRGKDFLRHVISAADLSAVHHAVLFPSSRCCQLLPVLLRQLAITDFSPSGKVFLQAQLGAADHVTEVQRVFILQALYNVELHREAVLFGQAGADALQLKLDAASAQGRRVFGDHVNVPNMHAREHQPQQRLDLGPNNCTLGNRFESVHGQHKSVRPPRCSCPFVTCHRCLPVCLPVCLSLSSAIIPVSFSGPNKQPRSCL